MNTIEIKNLTKDYGNNKGVFDVTVEIKPGEVYGYLGPNGAGKSTTMRHLMGFSKADSGSVKIKGMDCWSEHKEIQKYVGYLPGEIAFPDDMTGTAYLKLIAKMRKMTDFSYMNELLTIFDINPDAKIKSMSKGMKQKIAIVAAFMHDPEIILLDEPTSGLDPLMQQNFIELVKREKQKGKTIILSSHIFEEVEKTCDRVSMIRHGKLIKQFTIEEFKHNTLKTYVISFTNDEQLNEFKKLYPSADMVGNEIKVGVKETETDSLIKNLAKFNVKYLKEQTLSLEEYFMQFYGGENNA